MKSGIINGMKIICVVLVTLLGVQIGLNAGAVAGTEPELVLYSGRSKSLVEPIIKSFEARTGIDVRIKYGNTAQLSLALAEEGKNSPADVFWSQDAGALGAVSKAGLFSVLPADIYEGFPEMFRQDSGQWVATSGRARVLAYSSKRVDASNLPTSVFDLSKPEYSDRVGWAPTNASFQSFVTALRVARGDEATEAWLRAMKKNGAKAYPKNTAIIQAIAAGEVDFGLPNHYYLLRFKKSDKKFPVEQTFFAANDPGNLVNVAGIGILATSRNRDEAEQFVRFLLGQTAQQYFCSDVFEYPVISGVIPNSQLLTHEELIKTAPEIPLNDLNDLEGTLVLLRKVGLL